MATRVIRDESVEQQRNKWAAEIGRFVLAFGAIESFTYSALRLCLPDRIGQALIDGGLGLQQRIDVLIATADAHARSPWTAFAAVLGEVKQLAGKRNLIAHSGLAHDVYIDADGQLYVEEAVSSAKKPPNKHVKKTASQKVAFHELLDHRQQARHLRKN
jgi:hypothetical protein